MKAYEVGEPGHFYGILQKGLTVKMDPYPHVEMGNGFRIGLSSRDTKSLVVKEMRPETDREMAVRMLPQQQGWSINNEKWAAETGERQQISTGRLVVLECDCIELKDKNTGKPSGKHLIVAEKEKSQNVFVLWRIPSGFRGDSRLEESDVKILATNKTGGALGRTLQVLAILKPGQSIVVTRSGRKIEGATTVTLSWDGENLKILAE